MSHLATSSTPIVAIVECGHEMFLRRVGGFDAVRAFLLLVTRTNENVFWMISMAEYAWVYLDRVVGISDFFPYLIETRNMVESDIEQAVMTRHEASGFKLVFTDGGSPSRKTERALRKAANDEARQAVLREDFFETLMESSRGNVQIALYLWLRCLTPRQDVIEVEPVPALSFPFVSRLPLPRLTALASILQHGTLTPSEHAEVFGMSPSASVLMFESLEDQGLIRPVHLTEEKSQDTSFMIAEMARRSIVDYLKTRNLFH